MYSRKNNKLNYCNSSNISICWSSFSFYCLTYFVQIMLWIDFAFGHSNIGGNVSVFQVDSELCLIKPISLCNLLHLFYFLKDGSIKDKTDQDIPCLGEETQTIQPRWNPEAFLLYSTIHDMRKYSASSHRRQPMHNSGPCNTYKPQTIVSPARWLYRWNVWHSYSAGNQEISYSI